MIKKITGSAVRTMGAAAAGYIMGVAIDDYGLTPEMLEQIIVYLEQMEKGLAAIISIIGVVVIQGHSILEKHNSQKTIKKLRNYGNE